MLSFTEHTQRHNRFSALAALRDLLLPELLSGKIQVKDFEGLNTGTEIDV